MSHGLYYKKNMGILRIFNGAVEFSTLERLLSAHLVMLSILPALAHFYKEALQRVLVTKYLR